ncbi:hypothetical protein LSH36_1170g00010 [Paralvinella palmiformis]|uniref:Uncharacterized protein n=1 Tax=Paralvinella palmiformis TaxID=53620 RepID=A0AAD9MR38_9ANNE|nr:hypothetical protein LSH36_1170g00010 [Paralvinella palmiformis]
MRYSVRTSNFRYNEWARIEREDKPNGTFRILEMNPPGTSAELYDLRYDKYEINDLADDPRYGRIKKRLSDMLIDIVIGS